LKTPTFGHGEVNLPGVDIHAIHAPCSKRSLSLNTSDAPPRHQLESDAVIDHREAAARELDRADQRTADRFAGRRSGEC
jgi:hypothetical protein